MSHPAQRIAINTGYLYAQMAVTVLISLYVTRLILAALGESDFGIFNVVGGAITMLTFLHSAMTSATMRFMSYAEGEGDIEKQKKLFNVSIILHFLIGLIVLAIIEGAGLFLFHGILKISADRMGAAKLIYHFMAVSTFITIISVPYDAVINAHENMFLFSVLRVVQVLMNLAIALYISHIHSDRLVLYGFFMALIPVLIIGMKQWYCHRKYQEVSLHVIRYKSKPLFKEMMSFASWNFLGSSASMIANYGQGIVFNMFFGTLINAAQGIATQINGQLSAFSVSMLKALNPVIAKSEGAGDRSFMLKTSITGSKLSFFLSMLFFIPAMIEMPYLFKLWLKAVPDYAVIFTRLLLIKTLIEQWYVTLVAAIYAVGNIRNYQISSAIISFSPILVSYVFFYFHFAPPTLYFVFILFAIIRMIQTIYFTKITCAMSINHFLKSVIIPSFGSFSIIYFLSAIPVFFMPESVTRLVLVLLISFSSFFVFTWLIGLSSEERQQMIKAKMKIQQKIKGLF